jgi:hypothetical protein
MCERCEELEEALQRIAQWCDAYPPDIFIPPTDAEFKKAHVVLQAAGLSLDKFSADMGRHCLKGIGVIARNAVASTTGS